MADKYPSLPEHLATKLESIISGYKIHEDDADWLRGVRPAAGSGISDAQIRAIFLANGFTVKGGQTDLKPYVFAAARALLAMAPATTQPQTSDAPDPSMQQRAEAWISVCDALIKNWGAGSLSEGVDGVVRLVEMLAKEANAYRAAGRPAAADVPAVEQRGTPPGESIGPTEGPAPATFMTEDRAREWAWDKVREEVGTEGWTTGDSFNFHGFFLWGWIYREQYELQRTATPPAKAPAQEREARSGPTWEALHHAWLKVGADLAGLDWGNFTNAVHYAPAEAGSGEPAATRPHSSNPIELPESVREYLREGINGSEPSTSGDEAFIDALEKLLQPVYSRPATTQAQEAAGKHVDLVEQIAQRWDECEWDDVGGRVDIGDSIRREFLPVAVNLDAPTAPPSAPAGSGQGGDVVAFLDLGAGGYVDLGTELTEEQLAALPKGRHMLKVAGTYGVDGYQPAAPASQAAVSQQAGEDAGSIAARICQSVAELPDRDSPADWPDAMLVTHEELRNIVCDEIRAARQSTPQGGK